MGGCQRARPMFFRVCSLNLNLNLNLNPLPAVARDSWCAGARRLRLWVMEDARRRACHTLLRARRRKIVPRINARDSSAEKVTPSAAGRHAT